MVAFNGSDVVVSLYGTANSSPTVGVTHRYELSRKVFDHLSETVHVSQEIAAEVICVDHRGQIVHLSAKACEDQALRSFLLGIRPGDVLAGSVAEVCTFGAFVCLDGGPSGSLAGFIRVGVRSQDFLDGLSSGDP